MEHKLYHYKARVVDVYDGDTCTVDIDLGLSTWIHGEKLRLYRINAPEVKNA
jgi:micrococcal nuclease